MRYLSVCSGIEAASVAWHHLGWEPLGFSEIEPFPAAVLAHRFPNVPNYGDMTKFEEWPIERGTIDVLVGGTPCQSFSVAGLRQGLADPRGNLMLTYLAIADRLRPRWLVWENVPGVLSSNGGRDFGTFLGALGELGYGWAYRVLDAQYVRVGGWPRAVPQRRRRVFVVGCLGNGAAPGEIFALAEGLQRNLEARRAKGKGVAADAESGVARCITTGEMKRQDYETCTMIAQPVPFTKSKPAQSTSDDETWVDGQVNPTLSLFDQGDTRATTVAVAFDWQKGNDIHNPRPSTMNVQHECTPTIGTTRTPAVAQSMTVRRLTPRECERLQGFPDDWTMIPYRGKSPENCPDGPRYKALGNSMACNCMAWIGERIAEYENQNH